jgi:hypothetical protein
MGAACFKFPPAGRQTSAVLGTIPGNVFRQGAAQWMEVVLTQTLKPDVFSILYGPTKFEDHSRDESRWAGRALPEESSALPDGSRAPGW